MMPQIEELLLQLPQTSYGQALKIYLEEELSKIDTVVDVGSYEEVIGREIAIKLIKKIFSFYKGENSIDRKKKHYI